MTIKSRSNNFNKKSKKIKKEHFRPDLSDLNMTLKEAYIDVNLKQRELSVVMEKLLPKDINIINTLLSSNCQSETPNDLSTPDINKYLLNIDIIQKKFNILIKSKAARIVAVHRVITNKGFKSTGIIEKNEKLPTTNDEYLELVNWLRNVTRNPDKYKPKPLDRIYIPKKKHIEISDIPKPDVNLGDTYSKEKNLRPISIPCIKDRCLQSLYYIGYSVYSEFVADPYSFAFRPGRSSAWAAHIISLHLKNFFDTKWVVEIDISKCFDSISHDFISKYTPFIPKSILTKWLRQGYILRRFERLGIFDTNSGIPQGGIISPAICNTTLDGMEKYIRNRIDSELLLKKIKPDQLGYSRLRNDSIIFRLVRYADDIVILTRSKFCAILCKDFLSEFLSPRGLTLSTEKTKITDYSGGKGYFKFVGYGFKKITYHNDIKHFIIPPKENVSSIMKTLSKICKEKSSILSLFINFNCVIRSWCTYYKTTNARKTFKFLNNWSFKVFYNALVRRVKMIKNCYYLRKTKPSNTRRIGKRKRSPHRISRKRIHRYILKNYMRKVFYRDSNMKWYRIKSNKFRNKQLILFSPQIFRIENRAPLTKNNLNFYNLDDCKILTTINLNYKFGVRQRILKKNSTRYDGICKCAFCEIELLESVKFEFHHKLPIEFGGKTDDSNLVLLCKECHQQITTAVAKRDKEECIPFIFSELLKIPEDIFYKEFS